MTEVRFYLGKLHGAQQEIADNPARFKVLMCGRRFGKSELGVHVAVKACIDGKRVGWGAPTYKVLQDAWERVIARAGPIIKRKNETLKTVEFATGGVIEFWSLDTPDPARSRAYHLFIMDEAGLVRNLHSIWNAAIRPTLTDYKGSALFLGTPKGRAEFFKLFEFAKQRSSEDQEYAAFRMATVDNPYIDPDEVEEARLSMPPAIFEQEYLGIPSDDGGNPFGIEAIRSCVGPLSNNPAVCFGVDLARSQDWTVVVGLDEAGSVCHFDRWQQLPWDQTEARIIQAIGDRPALIDKTGLGDPIVERIQRSVKKAEGYVFSSKSKQDLMEALSASIQGQQITFPSGVLQDELEVFEFEYKPNGVRYSAPSGFHDDAVCALALANYQLKFKKPKKKAFIGITGINTKEKKDDQWQPINKPELIGL